jgi:hypothetical protein
MRSSFSAGWRRFDAEAREKLSVTKQKTTSLEEIVRSILRCARGHCRLTRKSKVVRKVAQMTTSITMRFDKFNELLREDAAMKKGLADAAAPSVLFFECENCGHAFESWPRLRQHQVDCQTEDT